MRFIVKPAGFALIIVSISSLAGFALSRQGTSKGVSSPGSESQTVRATVTPLQMGIAQSTAAVRLSTQEQELLPATSLASSKWSVLTQEAESDAHVFPCTLPHFAQLRRVRIRVLPKDPWGVQLYQTLSGPLATGAHIRVSLWARSKDSCPVTVVCEHNVSPYDKLATRTFVLTPQWQKYEMDWTADHDTAPKWAQVGLQLGAKVGEIDLAGASLVSSTASAKSP